MQTKMRIDAITIGKRARKDLGDLRPLAESIRLTGILHPPAVTPDGELICGQRRLEAARLLGMEEVPVTIIDIPSIVVGEAIENALRKSLRPTEILAIATAILDEERKRAAARRGTRTDLGEDFPEVESGRALDRAASLVGISGKTLGKLIAVAEAAEANPKTFGPLLEAMDETGSIDGPYRQYREMTSESAHSARDAPSETPQDPSALRDGARALRGHSEQFTRHVGLPDDFRVEVLVIWLSDEIERLKVAIAELQSRTTPGNREP